MPIRVRQSSFSWSGSRLDAVDHGRLVGQRRPACVSRRRPPRHRRAQGGPGGRPAAPELRDAGDQLLLLPQPVQGRQDAIRNRVLATINSTWGGPKTPAGLARSGNGTIRIATWTFKDMGVAKALVNARTRGVSVQVVAAKSANEGVRPGAG